MTTTFKVSNFNALSKCNPNSWIPVTSPKPCQPPGRMECRPGKPLAIDKLKGKHVSGSDRLSAAQKKYSIQPERRETRRERQQIESISETTNESITKRRRWRTFHAFHSWWLRLHIHWSRCVSHCRDISKAKSMHLHLRRPLHIEA